MKKMIWCIDIEEIKLCKESQYYRYIDFEKIEPVEPDWPACFQRRRSFTQRTQRSTKTATWREGGRSLERQW